MKIAVSKKQKYLAQSIIASGILYYFTLNMQERGLATAILLVLLVLVGSFLVHRPNAKMLNVLVTSILPLSLVAGIILTLIFFPNLSLIFRGFSIAGFAVLLYIISLVNNIFLVVETRQETIPLYRVATTWSKILIVIVSIPLLAGVYKLSYNTLYETALTALVALLFYIYIFWFLRYTHETKNYRVGEILSVAAFGTFLTVTSNLSVSFLPTETFLRALFVSSILIFGISYGEAHLKNIINKRLITEHLLISLLFLFLLIVFTP
jgi:hypothetical protein